MQMQNCLRMRSAILWHLNISACFADAEHVFDLKLILWLWNIQLFTRKQVTLPVAAFYLYKLLAFTSFTKNENKLVTRGVFANGSSTTIFSISIKWNLHESTQLVLFMNQCFLQKGSACFIVQLLIEQVYSLNYRKRVTESN